MFLTNMPWNSKEKFGKLAPPFHQREAPGKNIKGKHNMIIVYFVVGRRKIHLDKTSTLKIFNLSAEETSRSITIPHLNHYFYTPQ